MKTTIKNLNQTPGDDDELDDDVTTENAIEDDGTPALDETDLEENDLTDEEAEDIEWEEPEGRKVNYDE